MLNAATQRFVRPHSHLKQHLTHGIAVRCEKSPIFIQVAWCVQCGQFSFCNGFFFASSRVASSVKKAKGRTEKLLEVCNAIMLFFFFSQEPKSSNPADSDNVRVVVRCRPMNPKEKETNCKQTVNVSSC